MNSTSRSVDTDTDRRGDQPDSDRKSLTTTATDAVRDARVRTPLGAIAVLATAVAFLLLASLLAIAGDRWRRWPWLVPAGQWKGKKACQWLATLASVGQASLKIEIIFCLIILGRKRSQGREAVGLIAVLV